MQNRGRGRKGKVAGGLLAPDGCIIQDFPGENLKNLRRICKQSVNAPVCRKNAADRGEQLPPAGGAMLFFSRR